MAGNQLGKSFTGAAEVSFHLTGRYPGTKGYPADGKYGGEWKGKRFMILLSFGLVARQTRL